MHLRLNRQGFQSALLTPDPTHDRSSHKDAFLVRQIDGQGTRLPNSQRHIAQEFPPVHRKIPDRALALEGAIVVRDGALHGEALVETKREGHEGRLAGRRIVGGWQRKVQGLLKLVVEVKLNNLVEGEGF
jgi:hypothetical protein